MSIKCKFYNRVVPGILGALITTMMLGCGQESDGNVLSAQPQPKPPTISSLSVGDAAKISSITVNWTVSVENGNSDVPDYEIRFAEAESDQFDWGTATGRRTFNSRQAQGGHESITIAGLSVSTTYALGIRTAAAGSDWSEISVVEFRTRSKNVGKPSDRQP